jgi:hypothetical protein
MAINWPGPGTPKRPLKVESPHDTTFQVPPAPKLELPEGCVLLKKLRMCAIFQLWYPGDIQPYEVLVHNKNFNAQLVERGFDPERVEWIVDYVWNFGEAIVRLMPDAPERPAPVKYD